MDVDRDAVRSAEATGPLSLRPVAASLRRVLTGLVGLLFLGHVAGSFSEHVLGRPSLKGIVPRLNMNAELSVPTWVASILLLLCAVCLLLIALDHRRRADRDALGWPGARSRPAR